MQNRIIQQKEVRSCDVPISLQMMKLLACDINELMNKYITDSLVQNFISEMPAISYPSPFIGRKSDSLTPSLNEIVMQKRKMIFAPVARYANCDLDKNTAKSKVSSLELNSSKPQSPKIEEDEESLKYVQVNQEIDGVEVSKAENFKSTKSKLKNSKTELAFDNEGGDLSTRCDVVYKTILRDFRRFYLDSFKSSKDYSSLTHGLGESLLEFTNNLFSLKETKEALKLLSFELACLLFPKEIQKSEKLLNYFANKNQTEMSEADIKHKVIKIHGFLYKFSIDKVEECFQNKAMCQLFLYYCKFGKERIRSNITMKRNIDTYLKASSILEEKATSTLSQ